MRDREADAVGQAQFAVWAVDPDGHKRWHEEQATPPGVPVPAENTGRFTEPVTSPRRSRWLRGLPGGQSGDKAS